MSKKLLRYSPPFIAEIKTKLQNIEASVVLQNDCTFFGNIHFSDATDTLQLVDKKHKKHIFSMHEISEIVCDFSTI